MRKLAYLGCTILLALPAEAQEWDYSASLYGWFSGLGSSIETDRGTIETELDFSEVWDLLDFAAFGSFEARNGDLGLIGDLIYSRLSNSENTPFGQLFNKAELETELTLFTTYAAWRVYDTPDAQVDLGGGLRFGNMQIDVNLDGNLAPDESFSVSDSWVDPVVAARGMFNFNDRWFGSAFADVGGFGIGDASHLTWQAYAGVGYRINDKWSTEFGYRYLSIEREIGGRDVTLDLSGPLIGITARF